MNRKNWRFFFDNAGYCVGRRALGAADLARAEEAAANHDWCFCWEYDDDNDDSFVEMWETKHQEEWRSKEHECLCCLVRDRDGKVLASLGGIWDPDPTYSRVVEAELAAQATFELRRQWGTTIHAH